MFTGIIEDKTEILEIIDGRFKVKNLFGLDLKLGQSIAHDGACMTIETFNEDSYTLFVMEESLNKTNFSTKKIGDFFNIERCLKVGDRLDGHFVSGHVDTIGEVIDIDEKGDNSKIITFEYNKDFSKLVVDKGSITINGVSLTVVLNELGKLSVSLIPMTLDITNLGNLRKTDKVNLEFDLLGKYILNNNK